MKIILTNTFTDSVISTHRTIQAAVKARLAHSRASRRRNGPNSYTTYSITAADGSDISEQVDVEEMEQQCR